MYELDDAEEPFLFSAEPFSGSSQVFSTVLEDYHFRCYLDRNVGQPDSLASLEMGEMQGQMHSYLR